MRIPCTCGCGLQVTHATKINHLNGRGKTSLRTRVLEENESLKTSTRQRDHQKKKRSHPSSNQTGNHKRLKVAQLEVDQISGTSLRKDADPVESLSSSVPNEESEIFPAQAYTDPTEPHPTPVQNQVSEFPIQMYTDPTESPPTSVQNQVPDISPVRTDITEFPTPNQVSDSPVSQVDADPTESPPTSVPNQVPEISPVRTDITEFPSPNRVSDCLPQVDAGPEKLPLASELNSGIEDGSADALSFARRSNRIAERTREVAEQRWGNGYLRDEISRSDYGGGGYRSEDEEDVELNMTGNEDSDDEDNDEDREEEDDDDESDVIGISAWDLLGEDFEREVASIGMSLAREPFALLTIV